MLPKPGILKGEVKEFEGSCLFCFDKLNGLPEKVRINYEKFFSLRDFYSQPFQPEMVTEYFEGWEKQKTQFSFYHDSQDAKIIIGAGEIAIEFYGTYKLSVLFIGLTVSQFITCCKMADINLTWKE